MKIQIRDLPVNYEIFGQGRPLVMLPGWTMSARSLAHLIEPIIGNRKGWQRIYIDPPGHGATPGADWITNLDQMLDLLLETIDVLVDGQRFVLYGLSLGAYLARGVLYHRHQDVDGLSILVPAIITEDSRRNVPDPTVLVEEPGIMDKLTADEKDMFEIIVVRTTSFLNSFRDFPQPFEGEAGNMVFLDNIRQEPERYSCSFDVDQLSRPFPGPTLIIAGRQDAVVGYKDAWNILDNYPRATFVVADRAGHFMEEKTELINTLMNEWLDRVEEYVK